MVGQSGGGETRVGGDVPPVSIVLTTLNGARYLRESLDSCLSQTHTNFELIIVDGGSTDGTLDIVREYTDPRIRLVHQQANEGKLPGAINLGLDSAKGDFLTWMQDDSIYEPSAIETMVRTLRENPTVGQVCADYWKTDPSGEERERICVIEGDQHLSAKSDPGGVCFMIRREVREKVGIHDLTAYPSQDADYRWRIAMQFPTLRIPQPLYRWRFHSESLTGRLGWLYLAKTDVRIRLKLGIINESSAQRDLAEFHIAYAFEQYQEGRARVVPSLIWEGVRRDPRYLLNRGVLAILVRSLLGRKALQPLGA